MNIWQLDKRKMMWVVLLLAILGTNIVLYRLPITQMVSVEETKWIVLGSLIDLAIVSPMLVLAMERKRNFSWKRLILLIAGGLIVARFLIPSTFFQPFVALSYAGFAIEGLFVLFELILLCILVYKMPTVLRHVRNSGQSCLFSFPAAVYEKIGHHPIVQVVVSEGLIVYYAFFSWGKQLPIDEGRNFSLHKNSSFIALQMMLIHAIIIETIGIHWWLHQHSILLSIVLLILNVYSIIFLIANIQAVRLNPVRMDENHLYISLGLVKKMVIPLHEIDSITMNQKKLVQKLDKTTTIDFIARDFDAVPPHLIVELKKPCRATLFFGILKTYERVALRLDEPATFYEMVRERI